MDYTVSNMICGFVKYNIRLMKSFKLDSVKILIRLNLIQKLIRVMGERFNVLILLIREIEFVCNYLCLTFFDNY